MLDSDRTLGRKNICHVGQFSKFCILQQLFAFKEPCMETRLSNIFKTTSVKKLTKIFLESSYRVLQVTFKWKILKLPVYFLRAVEFWPTFHMQTDITWLYFGKCWKTKLFRKPTKLFQNTPKFTSIVKPITKKTAFLKR